MRTATYIGGLLGLILLSLIFVRVDFAGMLHTASLAGGKLLWLAPYRLLFFGLYALGWAQLLRPYDPPRRLRLGYVLWVTAVREAIDRLLPVASVGGAVAGVRLVQLRGIAAVPAIATVIVEVLLTLLAVYFFTALGVLLLLGSEEAGRSHQLPVLALLMSLPIPVIVTLLLHHGSAFTRLESLLRRMVGITLLSDAAVSLDRQIKACLRRLSAVALAGVLQVAALISGSLEIWFVLRVVGHPVGVKDAMIMESLMQAMRHLAFFVPAGVGVQEAGLVVIGHALGVGGDLALTVSLAKRIREVICGVPALLSWSLLEGGRLRKSADSAQTPTAGKAR